MIAIDSLPYLRRLVREVNLSLIAGRGVKARSHPFDERVLSVSLGVNLRKILVRQSDGRTVAFPGDAFYDEQGDIVASRQ